MGRKWLVGSAIVIVAFAAAAAVFLSMRGSSEEPTSVVDSAPVVSSTVRMLTQQTATPVLVPIGTALAQPTETAVITTAIPVGKQAPAAPASSPTPVSTPLPLVAVTMNDINGDKEGTSHLPIGYSGAKWNLKTEKPAGLKDAPEPKGVGYYGIVDIGLTGKLAVMVDLDSSIVGTISESPEKPGTLYVGREMNGSLGNAYVYPFFFNVAAGEVSIYAVDFGEEGIIATAIDVSANIERELLRVDGVPASQWKLSPVEAVGLHTYTMSVRVGKVPGSSETFVLQDRTGQGRFDDLETLVVQQDRNADGVFTGEPDPQLAKDAFLISPDGRWKVYSVSPSGRTVQLISESNALLAGLVRK